LETEPNVLEPAEGRVKGLAHEWINKDEIGRAAESYPGPPRAASDE
jgi:hypothetical protein